MGERPQRKGTHGRTDDGGLSILVTGIALVATALLTLVAVGATLSSGGPASSSGSGNPQVATADHIQAQQVLSTSLQALSTSAVSGGVGRGRCGRLPIDGDRHRPIGRQPTHR